MSYKVANISDSLKQDGSTNQGKGGRRSPRIFVSIPIRISGKDVAGQTFTEDTKTLVVNRYGAKIATTRQLTLGGEVTVESPVLGRTAKAKVVWLGDQGSPGGASEATLEVAESQNLWGIEFPPDTWQEGPPTGLGGQRLDKSAPTKITDGSPTPKIPVKPLAPAATAKSAATEPAETRQLPLQPGSSVGAPSAGGRARLEPLSAPTKETMARSAGRAQSAADLLPQPSEERPAKPSQERAKTQTSLKEADDGIEQLEVRLRASRDEMQALISKFQELKRTTELELRSAQGTIGDASVQAVKAATREIQEKVREELDRGYSALVQKSRERLQTEASTINETLARFHDMVEREIADAAPKIQSLHEQEAEKASQGLSESIEQIFKSQSDSYQEKLAELLQGIQNQAAVLHQSFAKHAEETIQNVKGELRAAGKELGETEKRIRAAMQASLDSLYGEVQTTSEENRNHLSEAFREFRERTALELQTHFRQATEKTQAAKELLDRDIRDLMGKTLAEVKGDLRQSVTAASGAVEGQLAAAAVKLASWEEQALARLREHSQKLDLDARASACELQKQTEELSQSVLEKVRSQLDQLSTDMQDLIERTANAFHDREMQVIRAKFQTARNELIDGVGIELRKKSEENLELASEQLRERQQQAVSQAENLFRDRLAEILRAVVQLVLQPGAPKPSDPESDPEATNREI